MQVAVVRAGHIGEADLQGSRHQGELLRREAAMERPRATADRAPTSRIPRIPTEGADVSSTVARGVETEIRWVPFRDLFFSAYVLNQFAEYGRRSGAIDQPHRATDGLPGRARSRDGGGALPRGSLLLRRQGQRRPAQQYPGLHRAAGQPGDASGRQHQLHLPDGSRLHRSARTDFSEAWADRARTVSIPEGTMFNAGLTWENGLWNMRVNGFNVTDEKCLPRRRRQRRASCRCCPAGAGSSRRSGFRLERRWYRGEGGSRSGA